jgi:hypothetical protein
VRVAGLTDLSFDQIVQLGAVGVDPEFVAAARATGLDLTFDQIVQLGLVGVDPEFVAAARESGVELTFDQIISLEPSVSNLRLSQKCRRPV